MRLDNSIKTYCSIKRVDNFDIARGIGILLMVMGHIGFGMNFDKVIHSFHMPLFFFVSGYFYRPEKVKSIVEYIGHQSKGILVPYLIFALFYEVLHIIFTGEMNIQTILLQLFTPNHNRIDVAGAMWFLMCLFTGKLIYCVANRLFRNVTLLTVAIVIISVFAGFLRQWGIMLPICLDSALSMQLVIHVGQLVYVNREKRFVKRLLESAWWIIVITAVLLLFSAITNEHVNIRRNRYGFFPLYAISCLCGLILTFNISSYINDFKNKLGIAVRKILCYWGRESLVFLLMNELMIFIATQVLIILGVPKMIVTENYWVHAINLAITMALLTLSANIMTRKPFRYLLGKW